MSKGKYRLRMLGWIYRSVILMLGAMSMMYLIGCMSQPNGKQAASSAKPEQAPANSKQEKEGVTDKEEKKVAEEKNSTKSDTFKVQPKNPYNPNHQMHPVAYGTVPDDYKTLVAPDTMGD